MHLYMMRVFFAPLCTSPKMLAIISTSLLFREKLSSASNLLCINRTPNTFYFEAEYKDRNAYKRLVAHATRARLKGGREKKAKGSMSKLRFQKKTTTPSKSGRTAGRHAHKRVRTRIFAELTFEKIVAFHWCLF